MHRRTLPNDVVVTAELDRLDRVKKLTHVKGTNWSGDYRYTYNAVDQITQMEEIVNPVIEEPGPIHSFIYDNLQRLTTEGHTNQPSQSFSYDQVGNRTNAPTGGAPTYSANNRLMSYGGLTFSYDLNGNRETQTSAAGTTVYGYDSENRLSSVLLPDLTMVQYKYDAIGRRVERSRNGGASWERFSYDGADVVKDTRNDGVTIEYGNGLGIDDKLWQREGASAAKFFTVDHLGTTRGLTDSSGATVNAFSYDAYGNSITSAVTRYGYTGREADAETGLMYYRARFYDPAVGRFVSEDPIGLAGGINLFAYVRNNPLNSVDPLGLHEVDVHYYLTYYLVRKHPCFTETDAIFVANADQGVDDNAATAPGAGKNEQNANYHALHPGSHDSYLNKLWQDKTTRGLGVYLHYLQDTFSHSGFIDSNLGHGPFGHLPDKTSFNPKKALRGYPGTFRASISNDSSGLV